MGKWQRYQYLPLQPLGDDGRMVTGSREHIALSRKAATEGMVLLKNENKALPLVPGEKVALFGKACADYVKGGGGSGDVTVSYVRSFCAAMEEKASQGKLSVFEPLHNFYTENIAKQRAEGKLPGLTDEPELPADLLEQAAEACDTAVISINRFSGEGWDRKAVAGDFYLSENEQTMVDAVCDKFSKVIVVLNVGGMVDSSCSKIMLRSRRSCLPGRAEWREHLRRQISFAARLTPAASWWILSQLPLTITLLHTILMSPRTMFATPTMFSWVIATLRRFPVLPRRSIIPLALD